jgi:hypothetical protein
VTCGGCFFLRVLGFPSRLALTKQMTTVKNTEINLSKTNILISSSTSALLGKCKGWFVRNQVIKCVLIFIAGNIPRMRA